MLISDLSKKLSQMYEDAPEGEKVAMIHLLTFVMPK